jgi:hypothetical protein
MGLKNPIDVIEEIIENINDKAIQPGLNVATGAVSSIDEAFKYAYNQAAENAVKVVNLAMVTVGSIFPYLDNLFNSILNELADRDPCKELIEEFLKIYKQAANSINDFVNFFIRTINDSLENIQNAINNISNVSIDGINNVVKSIVDFIKEIENLNIYLYKLLSKISFTIELFSLHPILYTITIIMSIFFPNIETHKLLGYIIVGIIILVIGFICTILSILFFVSGLIKM